MSMIIFIIIIVMLMIMVIIIIIIIQILIIILIIKKLCIKRLLFVHHVQSIKVNFLSAVFK